MLKTLRLELSLFEGYLKNCVWVLLIALYFEYSTQSFTYSTMMASILLSFRLVSLPFEVLNQNESSKDMFSMLPVSIKTTIYARYLSIFIVGSAWVIISIIAQVVVMIAFQYSIGFIDVTASVVIGCGCFLLLQSLQIPFIHMQGVIKGRASAPVVITAVCLFIFHFGYKHLVPILSNKPALMGILCITSIIFFVISTSVSIGIVKRNSLKQTK